MPKDKIHYLLLLIIFSLGTFLRFYRLSRSPPGLYVDETAIGYNAYSILETGKDEYGKRFPLFFRSFGDYKMPLYIYATAVSVKLFDLSPFSVRFMSAFFGSISILLVYLLTKQLFPEKKNVFYLLTALFFAVTPWTLFFSRVAFEASIALFFLLLGLSLELTAFNRKTAWLLVFSMMAYSFSAYGYHTERFLTPGLVAVFSFLLYRANRRAWLGCLKRLILALVLFLALISPQLLLFNSSAGRARINSLLINQGEKTLSQRVGMYTAYFSPRNLFFDPDPDPQRAYPELSFFYLWMVIPYLLGIFLLFSSQTSIGAKIIISFLFLAPVPAALAKDPFSAIRSFPLVFPVVIIISLGVEKILNLLNIKLLFYFGGAAILLISLLVFWRSAFIIMPNERFIEWNYGYPEMADKITDGNYPKILVNDPLGVSYSELLFYIKYPPAVLHTQRKVNLGDYYNLGKWETAVFWKNIEVRGINWEKDIFVPQLIVATPLAVSDDQAKEHFFIRTFAIIGPNGKTIFNGYLTDPEAKTKDNESKMKLIKK